MPVVPAVPTPSVAPTSTSGVPYQTGAGATPAAFGAEVGAAEQKLGAQVEQTGDVLAKHALKMQEDVNASIAKDLFLEGDIKVGQLTVDYNSLEGLNKVNAYKKYVQDIEAVRSEMKGKAPNDDVARRFDQDFTRRVGYSVVDGARGAATSLKQYNKQSSEAVRQNTLSHIAMKANDDAAFESELKTGLDTVKAEDEYKGASPEVQEQKDRAYVTGAWATRLQSMSKTDPLRARDLLEKNAAKMDGSKILQLQEYIDTQIIQVDSRISSDKIIQSGALVSPEFREHLKRSEGYTSNAKWDYKQYSSGYGTKAEPGDENLSPEQRKLIHEQRFDNAVARAANIVDQFAPGLPKGTREALIELTYNAGTAWTSDGLGKNIRAGNYETAKEIYLQYNQAGGQFNQGLMNRRIDWAKSWGGEPTTTDPTTRLTQAMDKARERAVEVFPNNPAKQAQYLDTIQNRLRNDNSVMEQATRQMQLQMKNTVEKELLNDNSVTSYERLSPTAKQAYDLSPDSQKDVFNKQMLKNASQDVPDTDARQQLFLTIRGEALGTEADKFMSRNISNLDLTRPQKKILTQMQQDRAMTLQRGEKLSSMMATMSPFLREAGIGQDKNDTEKQKQYNRYAGMLDKEVEAFEAGKGRKASDSEIRQIGNDLLREVVLEKGTFWNTTGRAFELQLRPGYEAADWDNIPAGRAFLDLRDNKIKRKPL